MRILRNAFFKGQRWVSKDFVEVDKNIYFDGMNISVDLRFVFSRFNKSFLIVLDVKFINKSEVVFKKTTLCIKHFPFSLKRFWRFWLVNSSYEHPIKNVNVDMLLISILFFPNISDVFWFILCRSQSLRQIAYLYRKDHWIVQRQKTPWSASSRICHHRYSLQVCICCPYIKLILFLMGHSV